MCKGPEVRETWPSAWSLVSLEQRDSREPPERGRSPAIVREGLEGAGHQFSLQKCVPATVRTLLQVDAGPAPDPGSAETWEEASQGQWAPRDTTGPLACKDSQDCRAAKVTRAKGGLPASQDQRETWEQEAFLDSLVPTEFPGTRGKAGPEDDPATTAATGPWVTQATRDPWARTASPGPPGPKDPKVRKANPTPCPGRTVTNTGGNLESPDWSVSRGPLAALGLWGRWVRLELQEDQARLDPLDRKDSQATGDLVSTEKKVKRVTWDSRDPTGFRQTTNVPSLGPRRRRST
nr:uncharacterized protein LOC116279101 [Vicugna pacos]